MGVFAHRTTWWFEYRSRKPKIRVVKNTGLKISEPKSKQKAKAIYQAYCLAMKMRPPQVYMQGILESIYNFDGNNTNKFPLPNIWDSYIEWLDGKGRSSSKRNMVYQKNLVTSFIKWAEAQNIDSVPLVNLPIARLYVKFLRKTGNSNKTIREKTFVLSRVWDAVDQLQGGIHNPWKAVRPDDDGSSIRHEAFTEEQIPLVLEACKKFGHGWYRASLIALYTGLRYGDIALLDWSQIDLTKGILTVTPSKTKHSSGVTLKIPIAPTLRAELKEGGTGYVLPDHAVYYERFRRNFVSVPFSAVLKSVGLPIPAYSFHSWRHTANSRMAEAGVPNEIRQLICGWTNASMARHYDHSQHLRELTEAVNKI